MTITWPDESSTICHGATRAVGEACGPLDDLDIECQPGLIPRTYAGGGGPSHDADGNDFATVSFSVAVLCADNAAAAALVRSVAAGTPRTGTLAMSGGLVLSGAGLTKVKAKQRGRRVIVSYTFAGRPETP